MKRTAKRPDRPLTAADAWSMGLELPGAEKGTAYGSPALMVNRQMFAVIPTHKSAEPGSLAVRIAFDQREQLLAEAPDTYYITDHYVDYPAVLIRLARVHPDALRDLLRMARDFVDAKRGRRTRARSRR
jgi:hypothetical protein